jgi:hypothetical protein
VNSVGEPGLPPARLHSEATFSGGSVMKVFPNRSLNFDQAYLIGHRLFDYGLTLDSDERLTKPENWVLTYNYSIRAMLGRIMGIDREYSGLWRSQNEESSPQNVDLGHYCNVLNVVWESFAGNLFFGMDSSIECFTHAVNALGYLHSPAMFIDITCPKALRRITPANLFDAGNQAEKHSVYKGCVTMFPRLCDHWSRHLPLVKRIFEYHDATKHRHSVVVGRTKWGACLLKPLPKEPMGEIVFQEPTEEEPDGIVPYDPQNSLQSITTEYQMFMVEWLRIAGQEVEQVFGLPLPELRNEPGDQSGS